MARFLLLTVLIFSLTFISASCATGQVDINSASLEELDQLYGIGPVKAQAIIDSRPFENVDDLINVNGIGEITLQNIKSQGLACVELEDDGDSSEDQSSKEERQIIEEEIPADNQNSTNFAINSEATLEPINLTAKAIKSTENSENSDKNIAPYALFTFALLLCLLFLIKKAQNKKKNELQ